MGPVELFNEDTVKDELVQKSLSVWGLLWHENWPIDLEAFVAHAGLSELMPNLKVGKMARETTTDLQDGNAWLSSGFVSFGEAQARAFI
jgi:hypothetical protein